ncbi:CDC27 family protein [Micromonospora eburnea]|uniref:Tetratricopeptide repeat-containing protein n=1 Tax=Micromonospora eburnea TaxID=227316 RepID=A0A1C6V8D1_9ACTN|nr:CDC27 family protein [Micromonospora eburnea]SCL62578.1 hypothetical protein GA0070604_4774 [Micromonospora eburnea]
MAVPSRYPPDLIDAVVQRVADARAVKAYGAVTTVARQLNLEPRLVQKWVTRAATPATFHAGRPAATPRVLCLRPGLLHCRFCRRPMPYADLHEGYQCQQGCRPRPLADATIADVVGRAILRHAARVIPSTGAPTPPQLAALHADRVLARITVGASPTDITLTWRATPASACDRRIAEGVRRVATARTLAPTDPLRARQLLHVSLAGVDPATAPAHPLHAEAAALLAELQLRLGRPTDAIGWATYAQQNSAYLYGPTHPRSLHALHLLATVRRRAGHHQRAYHLYRQLGEHLATTAGSHAHPTLAAHAITALILYDLGHCQPARTLLADTITTHRREHPDHPATIRMTQHLTRIWDDCAAKGHEHHEI